MIGPTLGDFVLAFVPIALFGGLYVLALLVWQRQAKALERIATTLEKRP